MTPYEPVKGEYRIRLDANESFLHPPGALMERAVRELLEAPVNRYPDPLAGKLCGAFAQLYDLDARYVTAGNGSDELISLIAGAFFTPSDELVTLDQDFSMYRFYGDLYGVRTSIFPKREDLTVDTAALAEYINRVGVRGLIFSNPCNPTSLCMDRREVLALVEAVPDCLVVVDEAYMDFAGESILKSAHLCDNLIVLKTCSKAVGLAALRLGFAVAGDTLTRVLRTVKSPYNVNELSQRVGYEILSDQAYVMECTARLIRSRDALYAGLLSLYAGHRVFDTVYQTSTNFVYIRTRYGKPIYEALLARSIAIRYFGDYLRITAGSREENDILLKALGEIIAELE